jgi:glycosyltransferase involved in cell wall biosynthesis
VFRKFFSFVDEIIIADTGSSDQTINIANKFKAKIVHIPWQDDFALARNQALEFSNTDFNIIADAIDTFTHNGKNQSAKIRISRILPKGIGYYGRIHEQPCHNFEIKNLSTIFGHDGYEPDQLSTKSDRNERLLKLSLLENPHDPYLLYQLGKEYENSDQFILAAQYYREALHKTPEEASYCHDLIIRCIYTFKMTHRFEDIWPITASNRWNHSPDFSLLLATRYWTLLFLIPQRLMRFCHLSNKRGKNAWTLEKIHRLIPQLLDAEVILRLKICRHFMRRMGIPQRAGYTKSSQVL